MFPHSTVDTDSARTGTLPATRGDSPGGTGTFEVMDPSRCVVLVPVGGHVERECERSLVALESRGYVVRRVYGYSAIDQARNVIASRALADGFDELMWIDSDIGFDPGDVERLRAHELPLICGIYAKKGDRSVACHLLPDTERVIFGNGGGPLEILYAGTGFLHTRREVYETIAHHEKLPVCNERFGSAITPYFQPLIIPDGSGHWYLGEDFAFSERARRSGFQVMADSRIRLDHYGRHGFSWEDMGADKPRYASYDFRVTR